MPFPLPSPLAPTPSSSGGELFPVQAPTKHKPRISDSSDFGSFHDAGPLSTWEHVEGDEEHPLGEHDLLGSFDELSVASQPEGSRTTTPKLLSNEFTDQAQARTAQRQTDLLGEIDDLLHHEEVISAQPPTQPTPSHLQHWSPFPPHGPQKFPTSRKPPTPVSIPPPDASPSSRPIPPPLRSPPRRMSQVLSSRPPLSPPLMSAGAADDDLLWQSPSQLGLAEEPSTSFGEADDSMKRWRKASFSGESGSHSPFTGPSSLRSQTMPKPSSPRTSRGSPSHNASGLLNTLATTTKIASKWKTVLGPSTFTPPTPGSTADYMDNAPTPSSMPTSINHDTPFSHRQGSYHAYVPPSGAPGFKGDDEEKRALEWIQRERASVQNPEWTGTKLLGRRSETRVVMDELAADAVS